MEYEVVYTNRRSMAIYVRRNGKIEVRCNKRTPDREIEKFLLEKKNWIEKTQKKILSAEKLVLTEEDRKKALSLADKILLKKVQYYGEKLGVKPTQIKIGNASSYWGCCTGKNAVCFSWRLFLARESAIDYVIVHELAHIKEHNHSAKFWECVERVLPNYREERDYLKNFALKT
ncbi:MAG: M48 family metallopeptidase [Clostridia bacterium]|nr:M48 family metallopeptidase [Clostridia bacterium]